MIAGDSDTSTVDEPAGDKLAVEVACALPERQKIVKLTVSPGTTARQAVRLSNIALAFPEIDVDSAPLGIFGQLLGSKGLPSAEQYELQPLDRVEIYRPLKIDPKEVRKQRAARAQRQRGS